MKKVAMNILSLLTIASCMVFMAGTATAGMTSSASQDANKLNAEITMLNSDAKIPQGERTILKQLMDSFNVSSDKMNLLLDRNLQYGDIAAVLSFAGKMPGGATDANINQVVNMRNKSGWDQIAKSLNVNISDVASKLSSIEDDAHNNIKLALAESFAAGQAAGGAGESMPDSGMSDAATGGTGTNGGATGGTDSGMNSGSSEGHGGSGY